jgi:LuxR family transcriptional regulator
LLFSTKKRLIETHWESRKPDGVTSTLAEIHQRSAKSSDSILLELSSKLRDAEGSQEVAQLLVEAISPFGYDKFVYARSPGEDSKVTEYISLTNLDPAWMQYYVSNQLYDSDYAFVHCINSSNPLLWSTFPEMFENGLISADNMKVMDIGRDWGVSNGVTIPLPCFGRYHAGISLVGDPNADRKEQEQIFMAEEKEISTIVKIFHAAVNMGTISRDYFGLSRREVEVLQWSSDGLRTKEIAEKLKTSVHTVEKQAKSARERLAATSSTQAVAKAVLLGIIS